MSRAALVRLLAVGFIALGCLVTLVPVGSSAAGASAASSTSATKSKTVSRTFLDDGKTKVIDKRTVHVTVDDTKDLRSLQQVNVSWTGAHQTNGVATDVNSDFAQNEEYSFDLFECRGVDSTKVPVKDRITPETCWTEFADERFRDSYDAYPAWRSDRYATAAQRSASVDAEPASKQPASCHDQLIGVEAQRWLPFDEADGKVAPGGPDGCAGQAPEGTPENLSSLDLPSNETFGVSNAKGDGQAKFDIFTAEDHASLGCSQTVPCSLVAVPIEGISCDAAGSKLPASDRPTGSDLADATSNCESKGNFTPGELLNNVEESGDPAVDGTLWWSASNWRNRISFPLTFAEPDNICDVVSKATPVDIYGSGLMTQATNQWAPHFCLNKKLFDLKHVQTSEPEARTLLASNSIQAALTSEAQPGGYPTPTVNAPVSVTGFGIAFDIDGANGQPITHLNLDARLLAKLLTESYPDEPFVKDTYPLTNGVATLSNNPLNITEDPEFKALNPDVPESNAEAASTLLTLDAGSDTMHALTTYINDDPTARAWLNGAPDPWGMRVNPNYKGIKLPLDTWPTLDTYEPLEEYQIGRNDCLSVDHVPYLPLVAAPTSSLYNVGLDMQFAIAQSQTTCVLPSPIPGSLSGAKLTANGRQIPGHRFMLGTVALGDARREGLTIASLESYASPSAATKFTNSSGRTFVSPSDASLRSVVALLKPDKTTGTWLIPYSAIRKDAKTAPYPGTMVVYAAVPTKGLPSSIAKDYSEFLQFSAGPGQKPGLSAGELPPGYLPLTAANGGKQMADYTLRAADAVKAQQGQLPALTGPAPSDKPSSRSSPNPTASSGTTSSNDGTGGSGPPTVPAVTAPKTGSATTSAKPPVTSPPEVAVASLGVTQAIQAGLGRDLVPALVILILLAGGSAGVIKLRGSRRRP